MRTVAILVAAALAGCSLNRPYVHSVTEDKHLDGTTTTTTQTMKATTLATWPATADVQKQSISASKSAWRVGQSGIDADGAGGTNGVEALRVVDSILGKIRP